MTFLRIVISLYFLFEYDLFGKPVPTFPDHALMRAPGMTTLRSSLRRLGVLSNRRTRADQITVAIDVVDAADRTPIFVGSRRAGREAALGAAVGAGPIIVSDVVHGVRGVAQGRCL